MSILSRQYRNQIHTLKTFRFCLLLLHLCFYFIAYLYTQMSKNFSLQQLFKTGNLDSSLTLRQNKLDLMTRFMEIKTINSKSKHN